MSDFALTLRVDAPPLLGERSAMLSERSEELRARLYRDLRLKVHSRAWVTVKPASPQGASTIDKLIELREAGTAIVGSATLTEIFDRRDVRGAEWFHLATRTVDDFSLWDDYPSCRAGALPRVHALNHTFASSAFVSACQRRKLTGVSFLRCATIGRKPGEPWFVALPDRSLGRGLDHPWFDRARWLRDTKERPDRRSSAIEVGQWAFHQCWMRDAAKREAPLDRILRLCPTPAEFTTGIEGLQIVTIPRYWTDALPSTDFAYVPWGEDGPNVEGKMLRFRMLAVSAPARVRLLEAGLFKENAFLPVRTVGCVEAGVEILDGRYEPIPPMYLPSELAALRVQERLSSRLERRFTGGIDG